MTVSRIGHFWPSGARSGRSAASPEARRGSKRRFEALLGPPRRLQEPSGVALERFWLAFGTPGTSKTLIEVALRVKLVGSRSDYLEPQRHSNSQALDGERVGVPRNESKVLIPPEPSRRIPMVEEPDAVVYLSAPPNARCLGWQSHRPHWELPARAHSHATASSYKEYSKVLRSACASTTSAYQPL